LTDIKGVTFLAYGNGAPDIFSAIAAFSHSDENSSAPELGIQALFGEIFLIFILTIITI
jgi:sodium/potassium/calcium exchanger 6